MPKSGSALLQRIEDDALNEDESLAGVLRKCIAFGSRVGSSELSAWASKELHGYETGDAPVPTYRTVNAPLAVDAVVPPFGQIVTENVVSSLNFPDGYGKLINEQLTLCHPVEELEALVANCERKGEPLRATSDLAPLLINRMNKTDGRPGQRVLALYWLVNPATGRGVLGRIRTAVIEFVAELRAQAGADADLPSATQTDSAFTVVFNGFFPGAKIGVGINTGDNVSEKKTTIKGVKATVKDAHAPVVIGSSEVTVTTTTGVDLEKAGEFAQYVAQIVGTLKLGADDQSALESAAGELEVAIADPATADHGRVRALLNRMVALVGKAAPSVVTKVAVGLAVEAAKQQLPALEEIAHHL